MVITGKTQLLGVIGDPITHSLSPVMHNAALADLGVDWVYLPFAVAPEQLETAVRGFAAIGLGGFNVTIPHKQAIMPLLAGVSEVAQAVGAVNTVWRTDAGWWGTNTDVVGFLAPLQALGQAWSQSHATILGCGGAARAVVAGCAQLGCQVIYVVGRDVAKVAAFHASWSQRDVCDRLFVATWEQLPQLLPTTQLLVNATPVGMHPQVDQSPLTTAEMALLPPESIAYDLIYTPNPTLFLKLAQKRDLRAIDGLEMLIQQGAAALQIWLQRQVPIPVMEAALRQYLGLAGGRG